jgi:hypothetical protein
MTEDPTKKLNGEPEPTEDLHAGLSDRALLEMILARLSTLEARFDGRDTNPLLPPNFVERFTALEKEARLTNRKFDKLASDMLEMDAQQRDLTARVEALEQPAN